MTLVNCTLIAWRPGRGVEVPHPIAAGNRLEGRDCQGWRLRHRLGDATGGSALDPGRPGGLHNRKRMRLPTVQLVSLPFLTLRPAAGAPRDGTVSGRNRGDRTWVETLIRSRMRPSTTSRT